MNDGRELIEALEQIEKEKAVRLPQTIINGDSLSQSISIFMQRFPLFPPSASGW